MKFSKDNKINYGQDFFQKVGIPHGVDFCVSVVDSNCVKLTAPGYGGKPYGNGALYVRLSMNKGIRWSRILAAAQHGVQSDPLPAADDGSNSNSAGG